MGPLAAVGALGCSLVSLVVNPALGRLGLYDTEHSRCNRLMTLGFKGLTPRWVLENGLTIFGAVGYDRNRNAAIIISRCR